MASATDTFTRANETPLASPWAAWDSLTRPNLAGNRVVNAAARSFSTYSGGAVFTADHYSQVAMASTWSGTNGHTFGVLVRSLTSAFTGYEFFVRQDAGPVYALELYSIVAGVAVLLGSSTMSAPVNGDVFYLEAVGTSIVAKVNGVTKISVTNSAISAAGFPGIEVWGADADNWEAADISAFTGDTFPHNAEAVPHMLSHVRSKRGQFRGTFLFESPEPPSIVYVSLSRWGQFRWGTRRWAGTDISWLPDYPDQIRIGYRKVSPARAGYFCESYDFTPTVPMLDPIFGTEFPDIVPTFRHRTYLHPTHWVMSPEAMTAAQAAIGWLPDYPDFLRRSRRSAYFTPFDVDFLHDVRPEPSVAEMTGMFATEYPDIVPMYKKRMFVALIYTGPIRTPGGLWTEPAITAISSSWTEPAITAVSTTWTEPAVTAVTTPWTEPAITPTTGEDE